MAIRVRFIGVGDHVPERGTSQYSVALKAPDGSALTANLLDTLTLTVYDGSNGANAVINTIQAKDILTPGGRGTIDANGVLTITLSDLDHSILHAGLRLETHIMMIEGTWDGGTKRLVREVEYVVKQIPYVAPGV